MPPSPAFHCSPSAKTTESQKRGRSFESVMVFREKDDDLALFNDMSARERENFLLPSADEDLDDVITTKLRYFSDFKLGVTIPAQGDDSDLLEPDEEKNDYDWLLTPPDTPLFPSLDDESILPINLSQRGRPRSEPITLSRSNTMEISHSSRANRTSASPQRLSPSSRSRLSPSSRSSTSTSLSNVRPSSAPNSGFVHPSTPQRRPFTPPGKGGSQAPARRMSTGSSGYGSLSRRGTSPVKANCGTSASPKLGTLQTILPGLSSDAPPNLRTSLVDHPTYVRGSSPASRSGRERGSSPASRNGREKGTSLASRNGREKGTSPASRNGRETASTRGRRSASPSVSRGTISPRSHDCFSSCSKGSVGSSCDDEVVSVPSMLVDKQVVSPGTAGHLFARRHEPFSSPKGLAYSRRASRPISSSSAPKCSFDSAMHLMDRHKSPQKMFRPLLSSVPSASFYVGKTNTFHQRFTAFSSTVTSSNNAISERSASVVPDTDASDHHEKDDPVCEWEKAPFAVDQEVFSCEKGNELNEESPEMELNDAGFEGFEDVLHLPAGSDLFEAHGGANERVSANLTGDVYKINATIHIQNAVDNFSEVITCFKCGKKFLEMEILNENLNICQSCITKDELLCHGLEPQPDHASIDIHSKDMNSEASFSSNKNEQFELGIDVEDAFENCTANPQHDGTSHRSLLESGLVQLVGYEEIGPSQLPDKEMEQHSGHSFEQNCETSKNGPGTVDLMLCRGSLSSDNGSSLQSKIKDGNAYPSVRLEASEGAGISLLLTKSPSGKRPVVHGKTLSTLSIPYDSPSYMINSFNAVRGLSNASCSSCASTDAASARQTDAHFQRQSSIHKPELESPRTGIHSNMQFGPAPSGVQSFAFGTQIHSTSVFDSNPEYALTAEQGKGSECSFNENFTLLENINSDSTFSASVEYVCESDKPDINYKQMVPDASALEPSNNSPSVLLDGTPDALVGETGVVAMNYNLDENAEECSLNSSEFVSGRDLTILNTKTSAAINVSMLTGQLDVVDAVSEDFLGSVSGLHENGQGDLARPHFDSAASQSDESILDQVHSALPAKEGGATCDVPETGTSDHPSSFKDEGTQKVDGPKRCFSRSITLEEATDTILFCSSIVHDLAYKVASIAIEKEEPRFEDFRPIVTITDRLAPTDTRGPGVSSIKRVARSRKPRAKEHPQKIDSSTFEQTEMEVFYETKIHHVSAPNHVDSTKPPRLESKCNCSIM